MCDFSYEHDTLVNLISVCKSFMILDHHKTAEKNLLDLPEDIKIFDMKRSGVGITWDFFNPDTELPMFLAYIQDRDLWNHDLPNTKYFVSYFYEKKFDFTKWEKYLDNDKLSCAVDKGKIYYKCKDHIIKKISNTIYFNIHEINNKYHIAAYCNTSLIFASDIGSYALDLYKFADFSCIWTWEGRSAKTKFSLRSTHDRLDISILATKFGGGGHRNAAGITVGELTNKIPLDVIPDYGIINIIKNPFISKISTSGEIMSYVLVSNEKYNIEKLCKDKYLDLIKKKITDANLIVFQYWSENDSLFHFIVSFNEHSGNMYDCLKHTALSTKNKLVEYSDVKEFKDQFNVVSSDDNVKYKDVHSILNQLDNTE